MKTVDIAYLILHYITVEDTVKCVDSIIETNTSNSYIIIIVDNGSPNSSYEQLLSLYKGNSDIVLIYSKINLGFANGNNLGFSYYKKNIRSPYLVVLNNDTIIKTNNFLETINKKYTQYQNTAIIGPKILLPNDKICPIYINMPSISTIKKRIIKIELMSVFDTVKLHKLSHKLNSKKLGNSVTSTDADCDRMNAILHGSFLILTSKFINNFNELFDSRTFLYCEEELLFLKIKKNGYDTLYISSLVIFHNEDLLTSYRILLKELRKEKRSNEF